MPKYSHTKKLLKVIVVGAGGLMQTLTFSGKCNYDKSTDENPNICAVYLLRNMSKKISVLADFVELTERRAAILSRHWSGIGGE